MSTTRGALKVDRVTITLVPNTDERSLIQVPSTFNTLQRTYGWRRAAQMEYMIVPTRISNAEVRIDLFVNSPKRGKVQGKEIQRFVQEFIKEKIQTEWRGLRLGMIGKPTVAAPPTKTFVRGTIEEMLGAQLER